MRFLGFDGKNHVINFENCSRSVENPSSLHLKAREIIKSCLPYCVVYEEVSLVGCKLNQSVLVADFFIPQLSIIVEVHGKQHYKFTKFFHKTEADFKESIRRDQTKKDWCELNNITYIELPYNQIKQWKKLINDKLG